MERLGKPCGRRLTLFLRQPKRLKSKKDTAIKIRSDIIEIIAGDRVLYLFRVVHHRPM